VSAVRKAANTLRESGRALRELDDDDVICALGRLLASWRDPDGRWQPRLATRLSAAAGFSQANIREGLCLALAGWDEAALRELVARELDGLSGAARHGHPLTSILCAGSIPLPTLQQIMLSLLVRSPVLVKPASRDPVTAGLIAESLREIDPTLGACVEVLPLDTSDDAALDDFLASECVVASGSDATIRAVRSRLAAGQCFVGYGHRFSVAALGPSALDANAAEALALDISLWDQLGCMSPVAIYAVGCPAPQRTVFAQELARALEARERAAPRGEIDTASGAIVRTERDEARMRLAAQESCHLSEGDGLAWTVVLEADARPRPTPLHRFVRIHPVEDLAELDAVLAPRASQLSTAALAGVDSEIAALAQVRLCAPGEMQCPPLGEPHDGRALLTPLLK
jgi:hypothetical protein